jgi:hypothetical protein
MSTQLKQSGLADGKRNLLDIKKMVDDNSERITDSG